MSVVRIIIFGEGDHELGARFGRVLCNDNLPALPILVHRLLGCPKDVEYTCEHFASVPHVHGKGNKLRKKIQRAILQTKQEGYHAAVVVIDRDRRPNKERAVPLKQGRDLLANDPSPPCAVGTAIEAFDAWMIVDGKAIGVAGGNAGRPYGAPEKLVGKEGTEEHPKDVAASIFGSGTGLAAKYAIIAKHTDLDVLAKCCPKGFGAFAVDVETHVAPVLMPQ